MFAGLLSKADAHFYLLQPFCRFGIFGLFKLYLHEIPDHNFYSTFLCESKKERDVAEIFSKFVSHLKSKDILCNLYFVTSSLCYSGAACGRVHRLAIG